MSFWSKGLELATQVVNNLDFAVGNRIRLTIYPAPISFGYAAQVVIRVLYFGRGGFRPVAIESVFGL